MAEIRSWRCCSNWSAAARLFLGAWLANAVSGYANMVTQNRACFPGSRPPPSKCMLCFSGHGRTAGERTDRCVAFESLDSAPVRARVVVWPDEQLLDFHIRHAGELRAAGRHHVQCGECHDDRSGAL